MSRHNGAFSYFDDLIITDAFDKFNDFCDFLHGNHKFRHFAQFESQNRFI